jgi:hypothetical protein
VTQLCLLTHCWRYDCFSAKQTVICGVMVFVVEGEDVACACGLANSQAWKAAAHPVVASQRAQLTLLKYNELLAAEMAAGLVPNPQYTMH